MAFPPRHRGELRFAVMTALLAPLQVGGQAVIEGVMMRSPRAMAIVVRRPDGSIACRQEPWRSIGERIAPLRWPFLRGAVVLFEAMINGIQALHFSAEQASEATAEAEEKASAWALGLTMGLAVVLALGLFVVVPHLFSAFVLETLGRGQGVESFVFHAVDGAIKIAIFAGYIVAIGRLAEIRRVFEYHGAEHKSIYAYEAGEALTVANAQRHSTLHPRCGTAFVMVVLAVSIGVFAVVFPAMPALTGPGWFKALWAISLKLGLMVPVAGISYEVIRWAGRSHSPRTRVLIAPGLWMQRLTTRAPDDDQVEVALDALKRALAMEGIEPTGAQAGANP